MPFVEEAVSRFMSAWVPTSEKQMEEAETKMLEQAGVPCQRMMVKTPNYTIHTIIVEKLSTRQRKERQQQHQQTEESKELVEESKEEQKEECKEEQKEQDPVMLLIHGFGGGSALWSKNFTALSEHYKLYAIDLVGFGRSCRPDFTKKNSQETLDFWVQSVEEWRQAMGLQSMTILAHSLGAYIGCAYALSYSAYVTRLILAAPFGMERDMGGLAEKMKATNETWTKWAVKKVATSTTPQFLLRMMGPLGPSLLYRFRGQYDESRYNYGGRVVSDYIYHISAAAANSGDLGFFHLIDRQEYVVHHPLRERLHTLPERIPVSLIYGEHDPVVPQCWNAIRQALRGPCETFVVKHCSHHPYATHYVHFHRAVLHHVTQPQCTFQSPHVHYNPYACDEGKGSEDKLAIGEVPVRNEMRALADI